MQGIASIHRHSTLCTNHSFSAWCVTILNPRLHKESIDAQCPVNAAVFPAARAYTTRGLYPDFPEYRRGGTLPTWHCMHGIPFRLHGPHATGGFFIFSSGHAVLQYAPRQISWNGIWAFPKQAEMKHVGHGRVPCMTTNMSPSP
jgi:hypothetical protein